MLVPTTDELFNGFDRLVIDRAEICGEVSNESEKWEDRAYDTEDNDENDERNDIGDVLQDHSEIDTDDDGDPPYTSFEEFHPWLLKVFRRSSPLLKGPELSTGKFYSPTPTRFSRVSDEETFVQFNIDNGFVNEIIPLLPAWFFVDPDSVVQHINWETKESSFIARYISMCATKQKRDNEIRWRQREKRTSISVYEIDASGMRWGCIRNSPTILIDCIFCRSKKTLDDIVFINARHLIDIFGIEGRIRKRSALLGAKDEWLAVQRIPRDMIVDIMKM